MIEARELRIGNIVTRFGKLVKVTKTSIEPSGHYIGGNYLDNGATWDIEDSFDGTELTEQWLLNFEFEKEENFFVTGDQDALCFRITDEGNGFYYFNEIPIMADIHVKYIHQLQNLYWCLVGHDLTLLPPPNAEGQQQNKQ